MAVSMGFQNQDRAAVSFGHRLVASETFKALFREGMALVEEAAAYLDGPGRAEARQLGRMEGLGYASESMRLTTRLMQLASWLLLQRAVNNGEMSLAQASAEKQKVKLANQPLASADDMFVRLPPTLRDLCLTSLRLQQRILHLDRLLHAPADLPGAMQGMNMVESQIERVRAAFSAHRM